MNETAYIGSANSDEVTEIIVFFSSSFSFSRRQTLLTSCFTTVRTNFVNPHFHLLTAALPLPPPPPPPSWQTTTLSAEMTALSLVLAPPTSPWKQTKGVFFYFRTKPIPTDFFFLISFQFSAIVIGFVCLF